MKQSFLEEVKGPTKRVLLQIAKATGGFTLARRASARNLRILGYHGLWTTRGPEFGNLVFMNPERFERRMTWLKNSRYPVIPLDDAITALGDGTLPDNSVVVTIDDGWRSTYTHMLPILEGLRIPATVYVTTWYVDHQLPVLNVAVNYVLQQSPTSGFTWRSPKHQPVNVVLGDRNNRESSAFMIARKLSELPSLAERQAELRNICEAAHVPTEPWWSEGQFHLMTRQQIGDARARGLDVQLHTHRHRSVDADTDFLITDLLDNRAVLRAACGSDDIRHFCYPNGHYDSAARDALAGANIKSATLCDPGLNAPGSDPFTLRRFLDGRPVMQEEFEAYLCGALDLYQAVAAWAKSGSGRDDRQRNPRASAIE
jgi:peptidoglycan/xylan/chitin deacetylase (PgdA/CDA1 family)